MKYLTFKKEYSVSKINEQDNSKPFDRINLMISSLQLRMSQAFASFNSNSMENVQIPFSLLEILNDFVGLVEKRVWQRNILKIAARCMIQRLKSCTKNR